MDDEQQEVSAEVDFTGPFTIDEIEMIEALCGDRMAALIEERPGRFMRVAAWVVGRRANPSYSLAEAGQLWVKLGG